jgi:hypothetical protein
VKLKTGTRLSSIARRGPGGLRQPHRRCGAAARRCCLQHRSLHRQRMPRGLQARRQQLREGMPLKSARVVTVASVWWSIMQTAMRSVCFSPTTFKT